MPRAGDLRGRAGSAPELEASRASHGGSQASLGTAMFARGPRQRAMAARKTFVEAGGRPTAGEAPESLCGFCFPAGVRPTWPRLVSHCGGSRSWETYLRSLRCSAFSRPLIEADLRIFSTPDLGKYNKSQVKSRNSKIPISMISRSEWRRASMIAVPLLKRNVMLSRNLAAKYPSAPRNRAIHVMPSINQSQTI